MGKGRVTVREWDFPGGACQCTDVYLLMSELRRIERNPKVRITVLKSRYCNREARARLTASLCTNDGRSGQVRFIMITGPKSRTMRATRQLMLTPSTVS